MNTQPRPRASGRGRPLVAHSPWVEAALLRTHAGFADMLGRVERARWLTDLRAALQDKLAEIERFTQQRSEGAMSAAHDHALSVTRTRIAWVERMIAAGD